MAAQKKNSKRKEKLNKKIMLPLSLSVLIGFLSIILISRGFLLKSNNQDTDELIKSKIGDLNKSLDKIADKALYAASICANFDFVKEAYESYYLTKDINSSSNIIRQNIDGFNQSIEDNLGISPKIHYHLPPAISFIRCWSSKNGDDISSFRNTILKISKDHQPIKGIEVGRGGFVVRGIAPVKSEKGKYNGSVEVLLGLENYLSDSKNSENEELAMFMDTELLEIATGFLEASSSNVSQEKKTIGDFITVNQTSQDFKFENLTEENLDKGSKGIHIFKKGIYKYCVYPVHDFSNKVIGVGVYQLDLSNFYASMHTMNTILIIVGVAVLMLLLFTVTFLIKKYVSKPVNDAVVFTEAISKGDLTKNINIKTNDEVGKLLTHMVSMRDKLKDIVSNIMGGAEQIATASSEISSSSQQISEGANLQASSTEEASSSIEEMAANIEQTANNSAQTEGIAMKATEGIKNGYSSTKEFVVAMQNIAEKIKIINDIAFQTNILALNAAVEAARAGEHGKGFAVVASEVRKLAEKSKISADEIIELSDNGVNYSERAGNKLAEVVPEIEKTAKLIQEITASSQEQKTGSEQVNSAIQQLNHVTQQNAAASEQLATSSEELAAQADQLKELVSYFKIDRKFEAVKQEPKTTKKTVNSYEDKSKKGAELDLESSVNDDNDYESF